jgi:hypothetical protein
LRFTLSKTTPGRGFVIVSSILGDAATRAVTNAINDPDYIKKHAEAV